MIWLMAFLVFLVFIYWAKNEFKRDTSKNISSEGSIKIEAPHPIYNSSKVQLSFIKERSDYILKEWVKSCTKNEDWIHPSVYQAFYNKITSTTENHHLITDEEIPKSETRETTQPKTPQEVNPDLDWEDPDLLLQLKGKSLSGDILKPDYDNAPPESHFYKKKLVFTGDLSQMPRIVAAQRVKRLGADIDKTVGVKTDIVVMGENPGWKKVEQIQSLISEGRDIQILNEEDFTRILSNEEKEFF